MWTELEQLSTEHSTRPGRPPYASTRPRSAPPYLDFNCFSRPEGVSIPKRQLCNI